jgi:hypothetical protein
VKRIRVIARAASSALVRPTEQLQVNASLDGRPVTLKFRTRYLDQGFSDRVPGDLWMDAEGEASDLRLAASAFTNLGRDVAAILALGANAFVAPLEEEVIYDATPNIDKREYLQRYVPPDTPSLTSRFIDTSACAELVSAFARSGERDRIVRATSQYYEALRNWRSGSELLALSHLFMGVEAVKKACWRSYLAVAGTTKEQLAAQWGYKEDGRLSIDAFLDLEARLRLVFQGDRECHQVAKTTSDHFEHGFSNAGSLYKGAGESLVPTARYLREAILSLVDLSAESRETLCGDRYRRTRGPLGMDTYLRAHLNGYNDKLAADGADYPHFQCMSKLKNVSFDVEKERYLFTPDQSWTANIRDGAKFEVFGIEMWDLSSISPPAPAEPVEQK